MIYIVEDDTNIRELVCYALNNSGFHTREFENPADFWAAAEEETPELVLLDIMMPGENGISVLKKLKSMSATRKIPVIMLTAKSSEIDKVYGFEAGADDYITKPFGVLELIARVKARLRGASSREDEYRLGGLYVCESGHTVCVDGQSVTLTLKEFELLCCLLENRNTVLSRDQLLNRVWGYAYDCESRTVDVHIRTLRHKLGAAGELIETVRGLGYKISEV